MQMGSSGRQTSWNPGARRRQCVGVSARKWTGVDLVDRVDELERERSWHCF